MHQQVQMFSVEEAKPTFLHPMGFNVHDGHEMKIHAAKQRIKELLMTEGYHLNIASSLGKDSSVLTKIFLAAVLELVEEGHKNIPLSIISHVDVLQDNPIVALYARGEIAKLRLFIKQHNLPVEVHVQIPNMSNRYLVNVIGGRTIMTMPGSDRKCSDMLKVTTGKKLKRRVVKRFKEVNPDAQMVTLIGVRFDESASREQAMLERQDSPYEIRESKDGDLSLSAIAHLTLDDIWMQIGKVTSGLETTYSNFIDLMEVYRDGEAGTCAVIAYMDGKDRSSGCGARFGCWNCSTIGQDKSLENMSKKEGEDIYLKDGALVNQDGNPLGVITTIRTLLDSPIKDGMSYQIESENGVDYLVDVFGSPMMNDDTRIQVEENGLLVNCISGVAIKSEGYEFLKGLTRLRNWMIAHHFDPKMRTWLARSVDDDGMISIEPNAYSPEFCEDLLKFMLSLQMEELEWAERNEQEPRFQIITEDEILAIEIQWQRYGYHSALRACEIYKHIVIEGHRYEIPEVLPKYKELPAYAKVKVPFKDDSYDGVYSGFRDLDADQAGIENEVVKSDGRIYARVNTENEWSVDKEAASMFFGFELDYALEQYASSKHISPVSGLHYLMRLGVVSIVKGGESEYDRMLRMANRIHRGGLRPYLNQPDELVRKLSAHLEHQPGQQMDMIG